jgi:hypothetical protein
MQNSDLKSVVSDYIAAFQERDMEKCLSYWHENAEIDFVMGTYRGMNDIEQWHQDRFNADMRVLQVQSIEVQDDRATVDVVATSKVARIWRMNSVEGRINLKFKAGKINHAKFGLRTAIPIERW